MPSLNNIYEDETYVNLRSEDTRRQTTRMFSVGYLRILCCLLRVLLIFWQRLSHVFPFLVDFGCAMFVYYKVTLFAFALAIRFRSTHIAPRCEARPRNVIYNPDRVSCDPSQDRGNPFLLGWVWWVMGLPYSIMLAGVPGTGTRDGGLKVR